MKNEPHVNAGNAPEFNTNIFASHANQVCTIIEEQRTSSRGVSPEHREALQRTANWLINCFFYAWGSLPEESLAIPLNANAYRPTGLLKARYSYTNTVERVLRVLIQLGWVERSEKGFLNRETGEGRTTTFHVTGRLREAFAEYRYRWVRIVQCDELPIILRVGDKKERKNVPVENTPEVRAMADSIRKINECLLNSSICLCVSDVELGKLSERIATSIEAGHKNDWEPVNYRRVILRRIFGRGSLQKGGRFYGGWWQNIPSEYRRYIHINGKRTVECDYSGMIISLLYGKIGHPLPSGDPYDVGLPNNLAKSKRDLVKKFIVANLNKDNSEFKLKPNQYDALGVTHEQLLRLVIAKHPHVCNYFGSDIGMDLQYEESRIAEQIMLQMIDGYKVAVLPVHDSYLVRIGYQDALLREMQDAFRSVAGFDARLTVEYPEFKDGTDDIWKFNRDYLAYMTYTMTNPNVILD